MTQETYSYDISGDNDDDQIHYHDSKPLPMGETFKGTPSSQAKDRKDKKGFFSRLFSSNSKEKPSNTPSLIRQWSQKTPNKSTGKQRSHSAPRLKGSGWQDKGKQSSTDDDRHHHSKPTHTSKNQIERNRTPEQRRDSFDLDNDDDLDFHESPNTFYGSSFHQSMDAYQDPMFDRDAVVGGTKEPPPQPYYLQSYNQLMHQRQPNYFQSQTGSQQQHPQQNPQLVPSNAVRNTIQRSETNSGVSTPVDDRLSRVGSHDQQYQQAEGLEDPAIQAFMEQRRLKKEKSRDDKLLREMMAEAALLGISPSKLIPSDVSTVEEKSTTYRPPQMTDNLPPTQTIQQQQQARRPSHTAPPPNQPTPMYVEAAFRSMDSYDRGGTGGEGSVQGGYLQPELSQMSHLRTPSHDSYDGLLLEDRAARNQHRTATSSQPQQQHSTSHGSATMMNSGGIGIAGGAVNNIPSTKPSTGPTAASKSIPSSANTPATTVVAASSALHATLTNQTPAARSNPSVNAVNQSTPESEASTAAPAHPLHDFVGIPKGVHFDLLHVMHPENAEILKIAAALLQKARRHPQLPKTEGIPREVAAAQLATMWLNQATFVRRRGAGPSHAADTAGPVSSVAAAAAVGTKPSIPRDASARVKSKDAVHPPPVDASPSVAAGSGHHNYQPPQQQQQQQQQPPSLPQPSQQQQKSQPLPMNAAGVESTSPPVSSMGWNTTNSAPPPPYQQPHQQAHHQPQQQHQHHVQHNHHQNHQPPQQQQNSSHHHHQHHPVRSRNDSRDYTFEEEVPYFPPSSQTAGHDSPGNLRAGGRKFIEDPAAAASGRRPSPMVSAIGPPASHDYPYQDSNRGGGDPRYPTSSSVPLSSSPSADMIHYRPGPMSRQVSNNNPPPPPPLIQQMSKRGYTHAAASNFPSNAGGVYSSNTNRYDHEIALSNNNNDYNYDNHPYDSHHPYDNHQHHYEGVGGGGNNGGYDTYNGGGGGKGVVGEHYEDLHHGNMEEDDEEFYRSGRNYGVPPPPLPSTFQRMTSGNGNGTPTAPVGKWSCKICTLINEAAASKCSACEAPRSKGPLII